MGYSTSLRSSFIPAVIFVNMFSTIGGYVLPASETDFPRSARLGDPLTAVYQIKEDADDQTCMIYNHYHCTTPHGECASNQLTKVDRPPWGIYKKKWFCEINVRAMRREDVGPYLLCKLTTSSGPTQDPCTHMDGIIILTAWYLDADLRRCNITYDEDLGRSVDDCEMSTPSSTPTRGATTTTPIHTSRTTTTVATDQMTKGIPVSAVNESFHSRKQPKQAAIWVTVVIMCMVLVLAVVVIFVRLRRRSRRGGAGEERGEPVAGTEDDHRMPLQTDDVDVDDERKETERNLMSHDPER